MKFNRTFLLLFYLLAGIIVGSLLAQLFAGVPALSWLAYYAEIGFDPFTLDLAILNFTFGMRMGINVAQVITISLALFIYSKTAGRIVR